MALIFLLPPSSPVCPLCLRGHLQLPSETGHRRPLEDWVHGASAPPSECPASPFPLGSQCVSRSQFVPQPLTPRPLTPAGDARHLVVLHRLRCAPYFIFSPQIHSLVPTVWFRVRDLGVASQ